jgi:pilus assembly protein CpaF
MSHLKFRHRFSIIDELQQVSGREEIPLPSKRLNPRNSPYQSLPFHDAVLRVQQFLRRAQGNEDERIAHQELLHRAVIGDPKSQDKVKALIAQWLLEHRFRAPQGIQGMNEVDGLFAEAQGLSVIEDLYKSKQYEEIEVVGTRVFCMSQGKKFEILYRQFRSLQHVQDIQQRLVLYGHARISEREPFCHSFLYDGSRLTMKMPPFSAVPTITIRRFIVEDVSLPVMVRLGSMNDPVRNLLGIFVKGKVNGIIAGDTGTGKTTLLHAMIDAIPPEERIVTLESEFELRIHEKYRQRNIVALQELPDIGLTMSDAFPTILRETPDRIIIGEVRSREIVDALKACSRGHRGTWFTLHLSDPKHLHYVLYSLYIESGMAIPFEAFAIQLGLSIQILIYIKYNERGQRVIEGIYSIELTKNKELHILPIVKYEQGKWVWKTSRLPKDVCEMMLSASPVTKEDIQEIEAYMS